MNHDEIIQLARIAGVNDNGEEFRFYEFRYLERFANLIAARERELVLKEIEDAKNSTD